MRCLKTLVILIILGVIEFSIALEPITLTAMAIAGISSGYFGFDKIKENTYCRFQECCTDQYISLNKAGLESDLRNHLFGQHIVTETVMAAISAHYDNLSKSKKPLVMSFHGKSGCGKNYVADFITKNIYREPNSKFVHKFLGRQKFPEDRLVDSYRSQLRDEIKSAVKGCSRSIFIFDEIDKMPAGIFEAITPFLEFHDDVDGVNYREAVYIFLTNAAGNEISLALAALTRKGQRRERTQIHQFEKYCLLGAFSMPGGLKKSSTIESSLIDHYVPFLPLEYDHVRKCTIAEFERVSYRYTDAEVDAVMEQMTMEDDTGLFVVSGCKRITKKVLHQIALRY